MTSKYNANLTWEPFLLHEMKIVATLFVEWLDQDAIQENVLWQNLFQYKTVKSIQKRLSCVLRRLQTLDAFLLSKLAYWDNEESKLVVLFAIYQDSELLRDFVNELIREKFDLRQSDLKDSEIMAYFNAKSREHLEINNWSESTTKKIRQILKNIVSWAGLLANKKIQRLVIGFRMREYLEMNQGKQFLYSLWI